MCFAANMTWLRRLTQSETTDSLAFFSVFVQTVACSVVMLFYREPLTFYLFVILGAAGFINIVGNLCNIAAIKYAPAATVFQFHYTQIITGALIGYLVWHDAPTLPVIIGSAIIIGSGLYIAVGAKERDRYRVEAAE